MDDASEQYKTYLSQLGQVEVLLKADPTNAKSLSVKAKLVEVVALYAQLLGPEAAALTVAATSAPTAAADDTATTINAAPTATEPSPTTSATSSTSSTSLTSSTSSSSSSKWPNGTICEFSSPEGQWFPIRILERKDATSFRVHFYGFGREQNVSEEQLRPVPAISSEYLPASSVQPGLECEAKYYEDGQWYQARVEKMTEDGTGVHVHFTVYGNTEEVPKQWLRIKRVVKVAKKMNQGDQTNRKSTTNAYVPSAPKILVIPDNLKAKEGDTDKERANKRKRMRSIQNKNRFAKKEIESNAKQASWQTFQKRATKKLKRGVNKQSQFSTVGTGGKVGVTGSHNRKRSGRRDNY